MPGVGFLVGGAVAALLDPRASYAVAGAGVVIVLAIGAYVLRGADWTLVGVSGWEDDRAPEPTEARTPAGTDTLQAS
jgi:hypothetical protein